MNTNRSDEETLFATGGTAAVPLPPDTIFERLRRAHEERVQRRRESNNNSASGSGGDVMMSEEWNQQNNEYTQISEYIQKRNNSDYNHSDTEL